MTVVPQPFDVCGDLPSGTTVLEASAGTGKTFTIAALAARYVAEGTPLDRLLLVTFTRMATGELRERVRDRFVSAERGLTRALAGVAEPGDEVVALLARGDAAEVRVRRDRLAAALADFDAATIATTHQFCQHVLAGLGVIGDIDAEHVFVDDARDLVEEVVDDLFVRKFLGWAEGRPKPELDRKAALLVGHDAVANALAVIEPRDADPHSDAAVRVRLAAAVRAEVERRKRRRRILTYDDLLTRLLDTLRGPNGEVAAARLRERYAVALVDEFQDTDPVQWEIMQRAFGAEPTTLVLIGDPKQAIYAFRGADVHAYLAAAKGAATRATLGTNWRSDATLLGALDALWQVPDPSGFGLAPVPTRLGHPEIAYRAVDPAPPHREPRLVGTHEAGALRVRVVHRSDGRVPSSGRSGPNAERARSFVADDVAADIVRLLSSPAALIERDATGAETARRPIDPGDIAVLVSTHKQAGYVRDALAARAVPVVLNGAGSVFATPVARQWLTLLQALERPSAASRAHSVALTPFIGWDARRVATADDDAWEDVYARLHRWAAVLRHRGVAALVETISVTEGLPARVLRRPDGERTLTDLRHIGQLLHAEAVAAELGVTALAGWLRVRIAEAADDAGDEDRSRRLDSDAEAVQVLTVHRAKGLEFPVVYAPFLWEASWVNDEGNPVYHDPDNGDRRTIDVGAGGDRAHQAHHRRFVEETRGEDLRLAYVALTRARHRAVTWWIASTITLSSPLTRLLFAVDDAGNVQPSCRRLPEDDDVVAALEARGASCAGALAVERVSAPGAEPWAGRPAAPPELTVNRFDRTLDVSWRRTSYSAMTAAAHEAAAPPAVASEAEVTTLEDEELPEEAPDATDGIDGAEADLAVRGAHEDPVHTDPVPLAVVPGGAAVGTLLHGVLEAVDFTAPDLTGELTRTFHVERAKVGLDLGETATVIDGVRGALETPLGPLVGDRTLRTFGKADRLDELTFELPLAGGDRPAGTVTVDAIADVVEAYVGEDDVLAGYATRLRAPELQRDLRGFLTGSIDVVLRVRSERGRAGDRFAVVDYKTNWLGIDGEPLAAWHYRPAALADAMVRAHYPLQALLYGVALHRYLRWRVPGYDPDTHIAGVLYLFLRGMTGPDTPVIDGGRAGVFSWRPPAGLIAALSDVLDRGAP